MPRRVRHATREELRVELLAQSGEVDWDLVLDVLEDLGVDLGLLVKIEADEEV